ncbi:MAG: anthranilate synthase component I family protein [Candidatus Lokiarchaeota archaeon]|nr:anthranilate synthase component I family protein [Candidatus Lokiarchaeota archaeon]
MNFNLHLELLGQNYDIFNLFSHLTEDLDAKNSFLLESVQENTRETLYSFICLEPDFIVEIRKDKAKVRDITTERGHKILDEINSREINISSNANDLLDDQVKYNMEALDALQKYVVFTKKSFREIFPRNVFYGGYLGYIGYDTVAPWVKFTSRSPYPDILMGMQTRVLIYNHKTRQLYVITNTIEGENGYETPMELKKSIEKYKAGPLKKYPDIPLETLDEYKSTVSFEKYSEMIDKTREYIYAGDIIQAVISRKIELTTPAKDIEIYGALRQLNPSPYMYYINFDNIRLLGSSPEALVSIDNEMIRTVPIAGTRKRGLTKEEDEAMKNELINDPKEKAEHLMLVDLARNDLAKVSERGTVNALDFQAIKKYTHLMHMVTHLESKKRNISSVDILRSMFPAGTLTGAPKLRAMEIINEIENDSRGPYGGVVGYFSLNGDADFAIAIRTIFMNDSKLTVQAGGGIVKDSQPKLEWIETRNKMRSTLSAIKMAEELK